MFNFTFQNSTKIHFGESQIAQISSEIPADARVLVTYGGGSIKKNGVYQQVSEALSKHEWFEFGGIEPNPQYDTLIRALDIIKNEKIDYLLAVGGGSVVDGTKFIAAAACYEGEDSWDIIVKKQPITSALPIGVVLTLPATGSETNPAAVITRNNNKLPFYHLLVRPTFAILDPSVTLTLNDRQISNGVVDAFVHVAEQYLTYPVNARVQDRLAEGLLLTLIEEGPKALATETKNDLEVRANIMWSATVALNGQVGAGVPQDWTTHMIGHELTGLHGIDHARTLSIVLPAVLKHQRTQKQAKLIQYAERVWGIPEDTDNQQKITMAIEKTETFFQTMGMPVRLADVDLNENDIDDLVTMLEKHGMVKLGEQQDITLTEARKILEMALV